MTIKLLTRAQINESLWDARVAQSGNSLPYALTAYLDIVTQGNWEALVLENYKAIFPLPFEYKLGLKMYLQPPFTQQLGLIAEHMSADLLLAFLGNIPSGYSKLHLKGNECNDPVAPNGYSLQARTNLLLPLRSEYSELHAKYSKSLRKRLRRSEGHYEIVETNDADKITAFYQQEMKAKVHINSNQYRVIRELIKYWIESKCGTVYSAQYNGNVEGMLFVIYYQNRIINLFGTSNESGRNNFAMHVILDHIVMHNSNTESILDFEGSDLDGVKKFYESFGPTAESYPEYSSENLPFWYQWIRRLKS